MHGDDSLADLLGRLAVVEARVRGAVAARRAVDPEPDDAFRGLYLSDGHIDALLLRTPTQTAPAPPEAPGPADPADPSPGDQSAGPGDLAAEVERAAAAARERGSRLRLRELAGGFGLSGLDVDILLVALAPDLDARFEKLYGYLHDDVTRRRASPGLALELCGRSPLDGAARARCAPGAPLLATGLLVVEDADRPFLTRSLRVPDRVTAHLLGVDDPGPALAEVLTDAPDVDDPVVRRVARFLSTAPRPPRPLRPPSRPDPPVRQARPAADARPSDTGLDEAGPDGVRLVDPGLGDPMLVYLRTTPGADGLAAALSACRRAGRRALGLDLSAPGLARVADPAGGRTGSGDVGAGEDGGGEIGMGSGSGSGAVPAADRFGGVAATLAVAVREARLSGAVLVAGPTGMLDPAARGLVVRAAAGGDGTLPPLPVVLYGRGAWDPETPGPVPLIDDVLALGADAQAAVWAAELGAPMPGELASLRLAPRQVRRAVAASRLSARVLEGGPEHDSPELQEPQPSPVPPELQAAPAARAAAPPRVEWLVAAARAQNATGLERLARRISPAVGWDDLVLPPRTLTTLRHLAGRAAHRGRVLDDWGLRRGGGRGEAVTALFVGESGTGKTMAAEVVAGALGVDMYVIDLSGVVDKYIGETEKNLERIFVGAEGLNAVLFFDEADALFGKRSEVSDARDRYANVEVAYLLQRIESFDGVAVLATNLAANLDDAFRRRLSVVAEFTRPDAEQRLALWRRMLAGVPLATDVDLEFCAKAFGLAGGDIRNAAVTAAYLGAANGQVVDMREIVTAVALEYRKLGRLCLADEFGPYFGLVPR